MRVSTSDTVPRSWLALAVLAAALVALLTVAPAVQAQQDPVRTDGNTTVPDDVVTSSHPDPPEDRLGWENGVWYNATLDVQQFDGIDDAELRALTARTMARVEYVRGIEFDRTPPVRLISREQQRAVASSLTNLTETESRALNVGYEALLLIGESADATESQEALVSTGVSAYYDPETRNITMISPTDSGLRIQEAVLAQELFHALQDQQFDTSESYETIEDRNAALGVIEGDANYVQYRYEQRCEGAWDGSCYRPESGSPVLSTQLNYGMVQLFVQPYNSGLAFVRQRQRAGGWDAIDALYDRLPESTEQTIHPARYPDDTPTNLTVADRSSDDWRVLRRNGERVTGSVGEAGWFVAMAYPAIQTRGDAQVIPLDAHINYNATTGQLQRPVSYNYSHPITTGWDGDTLLPYVPTDSTSNETAYVFETVWDSPAEAEEFAAGYRDLLAYHGAERVNGTNDTYRIPADSEFADAFRIDRDGSRLTIVNAPTVADLPAVRPEAPPQTGDPDGNGSTATATATPGGSTPTADATATSTEDGTATETPGGSGPGFGLVGAVVAVLAAAAFAVRRR
ncbi:MULTISPECIES: Hvo_1808 family surface protein [Salinibaculum]|uniref:Hvo_1808 family surface protein n=1 Tax=Salinibaculum TaxID=2732368 RepID=UPI0030D5A53B